MVPTLPFKGLINMLIICHTNNFWFFNGRFRRKNKETVDEGDFIPTEKIHVSEHIEKKLTVNHEVLKKSFPQQTSFLKIGFLDISKSLADWAESAGLRTSFKSFARYFFSPFNLLVLVLFAEWAEVLGSWLCTLSRL